MQYIAYLASYNLFHCDLTPPIFDYCRSLKLSALRPQSYIKILVIIEDWISYFLIFVSTQSDKIEQSYPNKTILTFDL